MTAEEQAYRLGQAWEAMAGKKRQIVFQVVRNDGTAATFRIGPHTPDMKTEDVHLVHRMWLRLKRIPALENLTIHHSDLVTLALTRLSRDYARDPDEIHNELLKGAGKQIGGLPPRQLTPPQAGAKPYEGPDRRKRHSVTDPSKDKFQGF
jgi:hypothetical protein